MKYKDALAYIHSFEKFGIKPGLERIQALCNALGNPQDKLKFVHVAGTNGKGSTCAMVARIAMAAGYKTGLYTSPYVLDFRERIQINGRMIGKGDLTGLMAELKPVIDALTQQGIQPTEFEVITAAAFLYFYRMNCDLVVLETGLGGRFDATNVIKTPLVSVITSISMDHMSVLGDTVDKIATEKCGIIKPEGITVVYPEQEPQAMAVIAETAGRMNNTLRVPDMSKVRILQSDLNGTTLLLDELQVHISFIGAHMTKNAATAFETAKALRSRGLLIEDSHIRQGIQKAGMPARMEVLCKNPTIILDGGHNEDCANALVSTIESLVQGKRIVAVCGMMADKDVDAYLRIVSKIFSAIVTAAPEIPRAVNAADLAKTAEKYCNNCIAVQNSEEAFLKAASLLGKDDILIICGSFYLASELRNVVLDYCRKNNKES